MKKIILSVVTLAMTTNLFAQSTLITPGNQESRNFAPDLILTSTNIPELRGQRSAGTLAAPTAVTNNSTLLQVNAFGHTGSGFVNSSQIRFASTELWSAIARGSNIEFSTTKNGTTSFSEKMRLTGDGYLGIGTATPGFLLNFPNAVGDKISLWGNSGNHYGFGIQGSLLQIHADIASSDIAFGHGTSSTFTETMRVKGNGNVGIGTSIPSQKLNITDGKILLESGTIDKMLIEPSGTGSGAQITLSASNGTNSLYLRASDATNKAGEILFYDPTTNLKTMELDGDWSGSGKSRIVVDELQITGGADLAEYFKVNTLEKIEAGTILSVMSDGSAKLQIADKAYDSKVVGVISGANGVSPGLMLQQKGVEAVDGDYPIAITGRVYVKADATKQSIKAGDLLTTSDMKGYAMKVKSYKKAQGAIIGKALTDLNEGTGMVLVLLGVK